MPNQVDGAGHGGYLSEQRFLLDRPFAQVVFYGELLLETWKVVVEVLGGVARDFVISTHTLSIAMGGVDPPLPMIPCLISQVIS